MNKCVKCKNDTESTYYVQSIGYLCYSCGKEYIDSEIEQYEKQIVQLRNKQQKLTRDLKKTCPHENFIDIGYSCIKSGKTVPFYKCLDCGADFLKGMI